MKRYEAHEVGGFWQFKYLLTEQANGEWLYQVFDWIGGEYRPFVCDLVKDTDVEYTLACLKVRERDGRASVVEVKR